MQPLRPHQGVVVATQEAGEAGVHMGVGARQAQATGAGALEGGAGVGMAGRLASGGMMTPSVPALHTAMAPLQVLILVPDLPSGSALQPSSSSLEDIWQQQESLVASVLPRRPHHKPAVGTGTLSRPHLLAIWQGMGRVASHGSSSR
jgi:hypothetical protein